MNVEWMDGSNVENRRRGARSNPRASWLLVLALASGLAACGNDIQKGYSPYQPTSNNGGSEADAGMVDDDGGSQGLDGSVSDGGLQMDLSIDSSDGGEEDFGTPIDPDMGPTDPPDQGVDDDTGQNNGSCDFNGFTYVEQDGIAYESGAFYVGAADSTRPRDVLQLEIYTETGGANTTGTYPLDNETNYATCGNCLRILTDCDDTGCGTQYMATSGTFVINSIGEAGTQYAGTLSDVVLEEATVDPDTYETTFVTGGDTWCISNYAFDVTLQSP